MKYEIWYKTARKQEWGSYICFAILRNRIFSSKNRYFYARFRNDWDKQDSNFTTSDWLSLVQSLVPTIKFDYNVSKNNFEVKISTKYSYLEILLILILVRHAGEYTVIIEKYLECKKEYPFLSNWDALFMAHQLTNQYNTGHTLFTCGQTRFDLVNIQEVISSLSGVSIKKESVFPQLQPKFLPIKYGEIHYKVNKKVFRFLFGDKYNEEIAGM